jgi:hypothetical protein
MDLIAAHPILAETLDVSARYGWPDLDRTTVAIIEAIVTEYALGPSETVALVSGVLEYARKLRGPQRGSGRA